MVLHHAGFVVTSISSSLKGFIDILGLVWDGVVFEDPLQRVKVTFLASPADGSRIELVEPVGENSPVLAFLQKKGGGMHHLCYETGDLEARIREMRAKGAFLASPPQPAVAFNGRRIAWLVTPQKLLVELLEKE